METDESAQTAGGAGGHVQGSRSAEEQAFSFRVSLDTPPDSSCRRSCNASLIDSNSEIEQYRAGVGAAWPPDRNGVA
jgi:hypothetical protein